MPELLRSIFSTDHKVIGRIYEIQTQEDYDAWLKEEAALLGEP